MGRPESARVAPMPFAGSSSSNSMGSLNVWTEGQQQGAAGSRSRSPRRPGEIKAAWDDAPTSSSRRAHVQSIFRKDKEALAEQVYDLSGRVHGLNNQNKLLQVDTQKLRSRLQFFETAARSPEQYTRPMSAPLLALREPDIIRNLKEKNRALRQECQYARYSLDRLQKQTRVTRMHELEAEIRMVRDEVRRHMALNKVMQQRMHSAQSQAEAAAQQAPAAQAPRKAQRCATGVRKGGKVKSSTLGGLKEAHKFMMEEIDMLQEDLPLGVKFSSLVDEKTGSDNTESVQEVLAFLYLHQSQLETATEGLPRPDPPAAAAGVKKGIKFGGGPKGKPAVAKPALKTDTAPDQAATALDRPEDAKLDALMRALGRPLGIATYKLVALDQKEFAESEATQREAKALSQALAAFEARHEELCHSLTGPKPKEGLSLLAREAPPEADDPSRHSGEPDPTRSLLQTGIPAPAFERRKSTTEETVAGARRTSRASVGSTQHGSTGEQRATRDAPTAMEEAVVSAVGGGDTVDSAGASVDSAGERGPEKKNRYATSSSSSSSGKASSKKADSRVSSSSSSSSGSSSSGASSSSSSSSASSGSDKLSVKEAVERASGSVVTVQLAFGVEEDAAEDSTGRAGQQEPAADTGADRAVADRAVERLMSGGSEVQNQELETRSEAPEQQVGSPVSSERGGDAVEARQESEGGLGAVAQEEGETDAESDAEGELSAGDEDLPADLAERESSSGGDLTRTPSFRKDPADGMGEPRGDLTGELEVTPEQQDRIPELDTTKGSSDGELGRSPSFRKESADGTLDLDATAKLQADAASEDRQAADADPSAAPDAGGAAEGGVALERGSSAGSVRVKAARRTLQNTTSSVIGAEVDDVLDDELLDLPSELAQGRGSTSSTWDGRASLRSLQSTTSSVVQSDVDRALMQEILAISESGSSDEEAV